MSENTKKPNGANGSVQNNDLLGDGRYEICLNALEERGRLSASIVQKRLLIGYGKAMQVLEELHYRGVIKQADHRGWHFSANAKFLDAQN